MLVRQLFCLLLFAYINATDVCLGCIVLHSLRELIGMAWHVSFLYFADGSHMQRRN